MRCISPHSRYSLTVFSPEEQIVVDARGYAQQLVLKKAVIADFEVSGLLDHEIEAALSKFSFSGLPEGVNPLSRIGVFDTEAFCSRLPEKDRAEIQIQIEERLRELQADHSSDFIIVEPLEIPKPYATYDEHDVEEILAIQQATGGNPETFYRYELANQQRPEILEAMLRQYDPDKADAEYGSEESEEPITVET